MIENSTLWKEDLKRFRDEFIQYNIHEHLEADDDHAFDYLQRDVFYTAFIIRKLLDSPGTVSDAVNNYQISIDSYKPKDRIDILNSVPNEYSHDWEHPQRIIRSARDVCNWLIHSFSFQFSVDDKGIVDGFVVSSDWDKNAELYHVKTEDWFSYLDYILSDTISHIHIEYSEKRGERVYTIKKRG